MGWASGRALAFTATGAALALAGCGSSSHTRGSGMMGGGSAGAGMGGGSVYHYSRLACAAPAALPGRTVHVLLGDMGMTRMMGGTAPLGMRMLLRAGPGSVPAGRVSLVAANRGWRMHELVVLPLAAGRSDGGRVPGSDGKVDETGSVGEVSASCAAGAGDGIRAGAVGWTTLTLAPGRYELVCNLPHHYADGMHQILLVTPS